jgi:hypothetical protein
LDRNKNQIQFVLNGPPAFSSAGVTHDHSTAIGSKRRTALGTRYRELIVRRATRPATYAVAGFERRNPSLDLPNGFKIPREIADRCPALAGRRHELFSRAFRFRNDAYAFPAALRQVHQEAD